MVRDIVFLPIDLIYKAHNEGWTRSLGYFVRLKSLYKNSVHYKFTLNSLAKRVKCSPATLKQHLDVLSQFDLFECRDGNICFKGRERLKKQFGNKLMAVKVHQKKQTNLLRALIIRFKLAQQQYKIEKSGMHIRKKGAFVLWKFSEMALRSNYTGLSNESIGSLYGLSKASGSRIKKGLKEMNLLDVERVYAIFDRSRLYSKSEYEMLRITGSIPYHSSFRNGYILIEVRSSIKYIVDTPDETKGVRK